MEFVATCFFPLLENYANMCKTRKGEIGMNKKIVVFQNPDDVVEFVKKVEKYPFNMDMKRGKYIVDAKSLLGLMNLGCKTEIELKVYEEDCEELFKDIEKYVAA